MSEKDNLIQATVTVYDTERRRQIGASTFTWIAGLSVLNSILLVSGARINFLGGLGVTEFITAVGVYAQEQTHMASIPMIAVVLSVLVAAVFFFLGKMARKGYGWAFVVGMVMYAADALPLLFLQDYFNIAFHAWFLTSLWSGFQANKQMQLFRSAPPAPEPAGISPVQGSDLG